MRFACALVLLGLIGCGKAPPQPTVADGSTGKMIGDSPGIHNLIRVNDWLYTGSEPEAEPGFQSLHDLGIRTVITVDGTKPDLARAGERGIRYVHIPIGYNAIPQERVLQIAKAMQSLPKPIYLHCHHGKHRGPAAAMAGLRCLDPSWTAAEGERYLKLAGTSSEYSELFASVARQSPPEQGTLEMIPPEFPSVAVIPDFVGKMLELDELIGRLKKSHSRDGSVNPQDAIALREAYRELQRDSGTKPEEFRRLLATGEIHAEELVQSGSSVSLNNALAISESTCAECHKKFRNHTPDK